MDQNINANISDCIVKTYHSGYTRVTNICSGAVHDVAWGSFDWVAAFGLIALGLIVAAVFLALATMIIRDI
jgi:hypothetical protein